MNCRKGDKARKSDRKVENKEAGKKKKTPFRTKLGMGPSPAGNRDAPILNSEANIDTRKLPACFGQC